MNLEKVEPSLMQKVYALIGAVKARGGSPVITSGYRTNAEQAAIVTPYPKAAPGRSKHNRDPAEAVDVSGNAITMKLLHTLAPNFGLHFPVANDPVHVEESGVSSTTQAQTETAQIEQAGFSLGGTSDFLKSLTAASTWLRVFEVIFGVVLIGLGLILYVKESLG